MAVGIYETTNELFKIKILILVPYHRIDYDISGQPFVLNAFKNIVYDNDLHFYKTFSTPNLF